jgi:hypothetical protein
MHFKIIDIIIDNNPLQYANLRAIFTGLMSTCGGETAGLVASVGRPEAGEEIILWLRGLFLIF